MEVKVRLGQTQRNLTVFLYPPPTLAKFQTDVIKLFKLPSDTALNVAYKNEKNAFIPVNSDGDFNDALKAREKAKPSFQITLASDAKRSGSPNSGRGLTSSPASMKSTSSSASLGKAASRSIASDPHRKKKEPAPPGSPVAGDNPLHEAVRAISHSKVVEISSQAPSYRTEINAAGLTPLHLAAQLGHLEIVSLLLASGCLIDEVDMQQNTALHQAAVCGHLPICRTLMQGGANLLLTNNSGCTVLHLLMGCEVAHEEKPLYRILINDIIRSFRFNMNARNTAGATALHVAASRGFRWNVKVLLMHNPDLNAQSKNGDTALHLAARQGDKKMAQRLLDKGADVEIVNEDKQNALQLAQYYKHAALVELLTPLTKPPSARSPSDGTNGSVVSPLSPVRTPVPAPAASPARASPVATPSPVHPPSRSAPAPWAPARVGPASPVPAVVPPAAVAPAVASPKQSEARIDGGQTISERIAAKEPMPKEAMGGDDAGKGSPKPVEKSHSRTHTSGRRDSTDKRDRTRTSNKLPKEPSSSNKERESPLPATPTVAAVPAIASSSPTVPPASPTHQNSGLSLSSSGTALSPLRDSPNPVITREMIQGDGMEAMAQLLRLLGLAQWIDRFRQEDIDLSTARELQDDTLQILGLPVGSRLRLIRAVRNIYEPQTTEHLVVSSPHTTPRKPAPPPVVPSQPLDPALAALLQESDLSQYAEVFRLEELNLSAVRRLNDTQLKELGLTMGARIRLLDALSKK